VLPGKSICRIGVFYDGSYFAFARRYFYRERTLGWLGFPAFHRLVEDFMRKKEQGYSDYKVVYSAWFQGLFTAPNATEEQLRFDRNSYHDLMHAGIEAKYLPMSTTQGEKGVDVALAVDAMQVGRDGKIDVAVLATGDGDFVPLVRALMKDGIRIVAAYFDFTQDDGKKAFINERLRNAVNYDLNVNALEKDKEYKSDFGHLFRKTQEKAT
jgi:uncharacterized LabA/DUF88 family protein